MDPVTGRATTQVIHAESAPTRMMSSKLTGIGVGVMNRPEITELATFQCLLTKIGGALQSRGAQYRSDRCRWRSNR